MRSRFHWVLISMLALVGCGDAASIAADAGHTDDTDANVGAGCAALDRQACGQRVDCVFDLCLGCDCVPLAASACRGINEAPTSCPQLECATPECCAFEDECSQGLCEPPGTPPGCGICFPGGGDCIADDTCATGNICQPVHCSCDGVSACTAGCTANADCGEAEHCDLASPHPRCVADACDAAAPCPGDFSCNGSGVCQRRLCKADDDCAGVCVLGHCYAGYGVCRLPVP